MTPRRQPIFGILATVLPVLGYLIAWYISADKQLTKGDETGLVGPVLTLIWSGSCLLLGTAFGIISLVRRETPKWMAWTGLTICWFPILAITVAACVSKFFIK